MNNGQQAGQALALLRIGAGVGAWLTPNLAARIMGLQPGTSQALVMRLFGIRDLVMGLGYLTAAPEDRDNWLRMGIIADAADALAAVIAVGGGGMPARTGVPLALTAAGAVAAGTAAQERG